MKYREAEPIDSRWIYDLNTDSDARANSYNSEKFSFESHQKWFDQKLADPNYRFYIFSIDESDYALVRFEIDTEGAVIGINVHEEFRGKGLARKTLIRASQDFFNQNKKPIIAYIKASNQASVRAFEKAGYVLEEELKIKGIPSYKYRYEDR